MKDKNRSKAYIRTLHLKGLLALGYSILLIENFTRSFWRLFFWSLLFCALWFFQIPASFGTFGGILAFLLFIGGTFYLIWKDTRQFQRPHTHEVLKRIELASALLHRPLSAEKDQAINAETPQSKALWTREQNRRRASITDLKLFKPTPFIAKQDPYALRLFITLAALCGFVLAGATAQERLYAGLTPFDVEKSSEKNERIHLIIAPPEYTGKKQIVRNKTEQDTLEISEGSTLKIIVQHPLSIVFSKPVFYINETPYPLKKSGKIAFYHEQIIKPGDTLSLKEGVFKTAHWRFKILPDQPPEIAQEGAPQTLAQGQFKIPLSLKDDYGVKTIKLNIEIAQKISQPPFVRPIFDERSVMSPPNTLFNMSPVYDFTSHPWAGQTVRLSLSAHDQKGQAGVLSPIEMTLPERVFTHPLAKALIQIRKDLIRMPLQPHTEAALKIESFMIQAGDRQTFMALRSAASRLYYNAPSNDVAESVVSLLWDTALHIEDGNLSLTQRDLKTAQAALEEALKNPNTPPQEITRLMQNLREALGQYISEIGRAWQKRIQAGDTPTQLPPEMLSSMMNMNDLAQMLDEMEAEILAGNKNAAQSMLSQLQRLMDMANPSLDQSLPEDIQQMMENMNALAEIIKAQERLLEKTDKQAALLLKLQEMGIKTNRSPPPFIKGKVFADEQEKIRTELLKMIEATKIASPESQEKLSRADQAMQNARAALSNHHPDQSILHQEDALKNLRDSKQNMSQQMAQRLKQMTGLSFSGGPVQYDPLGRPMGQGGQNPDDPNSDVKIPSEQEKKRIQNLVNEIRRRASQRERPQEELEYYRRLLKQF